MAEDYVQELYRTTKEMIELSEAYKQQRGIYEQMFNKLIVLASKHLSADKSSIENKFIRLMSIPECSEDVKVYHEALCLARGEYKGLELVIDAYSKHTTGIQSVIKYNISSEVSNATSLKYGKDVQ